jgi:hypothetical protein
MTQDLLSGGDNAISFDETKNYLEELVGDGKKFRDYESLAKGKAYADAMIEHMKAEQAAMRNDYQSLNSKYNAREKLEDLVEKFSTQQHSSNDEPPVKDVNNNPQFDLNQIKELVRSEALQQTAQQKAEMNFNEVKSKLTERFGNNYPNVIKSQLEEIDMSNEEFNDMARRNPKLLYRTLKIDEPRQSENFQAPPQSQRRSDSFSPQVTKRNWAYYEKMRSENVNLYYDPKTQVQMHKDAQELKDAFYD